MSLDFEFCKHNRSIVLFSLRFHSVSDKITMSATETETVSDLVQKMVISLCGDQKPGEVMFFLSF